MRRSTGRNRFKEPSSAQQGEYYSGNRFNERPRKQRSGLLMGLGMTLLVVGVSLLLVAGVMFVRSEKEYADGRRAYERLAQYGPSEDIAEGITAEGDLPLLDFTDIQAVNPDVVAWVTIPSLGINYPVVQADDNDHYLRRNIEGTYNKAGSLFMDYESSADIGDLHTIIYGHNMNDGSMFKPLEDLINQAAFDAHRNIILFTPQETYLLETVATYRTDGSDTTVRRFSFGDETEYYAYIQSKLDIADARDAEIMADAIPHLFTFSTCSYHINDGRTLIMATKAPASLQDSGAAEQGITTGEDGMPLLPDPSEDISTDTPSAG